jgi:SAM-dependent methyltransferase
MTTFQIAFLIFELILVSGVLIYLHSITISLLRGAPYVPTKTEIIDTILAKANLKPGMKFLELGCGDGRVVCRAAQKYGVIGRGVDISRLWLLLARIRARKLGIENKVEFLHQNILESDLAWADVIYIYMMPRFLEGYQKELKKALVSNKVIISHVFELDQLKEYLSDVVVSNKTSTYYYQRNTD